MLFFILLLLLLAPARRVAVALQHYEIFCNKVFASNVQVRCLGLGPMGCHVSVFAVLCLRVNLLCMHRSERGLLHALSEVIGFSDATLLHPTFFILPFSAPLPKHVAWLHGSC